MASKHGTKQPEPRVEYIVLIVERRGKVTTVALQGGDTQAVSIRALSNAHRGGQVQVLSIDSLDYCVRHVLSLAEDPEHCSCLQPDNANTSAISRPENKL